MGPTNHVTKYMGVQISPWKGALLRGKGRPSVKYRDTLRWVVQKRLNRSRCCVGCWIVWSQGTTSGAKKLRVRWRSRSPMGMGDFEGQGACADVPDDTLTWAVERLNRWGPDPRANGQFLGERICRSGACMASSCYELCRNGWTDRDAVWVVDSGGLKETWGAHWRNLANATEPSVCSGDAALCQISLTTCCLGYCGISPVVQVVLVFVFQVGFLTVYIVLSNVCRMCIEQYV